MVTEPRESQKWLSLFMRASTSGPCVNEKGSRYFYVRAEKSGEFSGEQKEQEDSNIFHDQ